MKTLLPILKTKLFLLSFILACTAILANNYIQHDNPFKFSESKEEKLIAEPSKVPVKTKKILPLSQQQAPESSHPFLLM